jgi:hypothetical protein
VIPVVKALIQNHDNRLIFQSKYSVDQSRSAD